MTIQDILNYAGIALLVIGVILSGGAAYLFVTRNISDIIADLNGTKRAEALEAMARENMRRSRRRGKNGETTGSLGSNTGSVAPQPVAQQAAEGASDQQAAATEVDDSAPTAVMRDDSAPTQVLDPDAADATTLLEVTDPQQANANEGSQLKQVVEEERIPDNFEIVRKIVLTDSTEFIRPEQGEQYA